MQEKPRILVVDDEPNNLTLIRQLLAEDYNVAPFPSGKKALEILEKIHPNLILLDIMMPEMDGYEVCRRIKANNETRDIPVIFVTAMSDVEDEKKGFDLGAVDYITKPIKPAILTARVKTHIELQEKIQIERENVRLREDVERITQHDLKSPLNGILNYPNIIKSQGNLSEKQQDQLDKIIQLGRKLLNMINLALDIYKMEQGTYAVKQEDVNLLEVFTEILEENKIRLKSKRLVVDTLINGEHAIDGDQFILQGEKLLLYSMLSNLFKNAMEASPKKERITIVMEDGENRSVSIHNIGAVPEEIRDTFFDKYATAGKSGGTGLGTYSARLIAETQGGQISLDTSEEDGTTIRINFPEQA